MRAQILCGLAVLGYAIVDVSVVCMCDLHSVPSEMKMCLRLLLHTMCAAQFCGCMFDSIHFHHTPYTPLTDTSAPNCEVLFNSLVYNGMIANILNAMLGYVSLQDILQKIIQVRQFSVHMCMLCTCACCKVWILVTSTHTF